MKIVTNPRLIKRNARIGQIATIGALIILGIGLYLTFKEQERFAYSLACLLLGFFLSQIGIYYGNRWGRSPRPDQIIDKALKGLGREYSIFHYTTAAQHLLVGPAGLWIIHPYHQGGTISYNGKRWRSKGGGFSRSYMRLFGQESLGSPELEINAEIQALEKNLRENISGDEKIPSIKALMLFTDPTVELSVEGSDFPALKPEKIKDFLKNAAKEKPISELELAFVREYLPKPD